MQYKGPLYAILAALLFGASTPLAKLLLKSIDPAILAGTLYFGAGIGLSILLLFQKSVRQISTEASLKRQDWFWLMLATAFGGIAGPIFLMEALDKTQASTVSLLLNLECVFTALCAWFIFKEHFVSRIVLGMVIIVAGGMVLAWPSHMDASLKGIELISMACLCWALDNNLTRKIAYASPLQIALLKTLIAGSVIIIVMILKVPNLYHLPIALLILTAIVGFFGYGLSLFYFVLALRFIGTARTSAYFSIAPFIGAAIAFILLHEPLTWQILVAGILMGLGVWLHLTEEHDHEHYHPALAHEHLHVHDDHHQHEHSANDPPGEPHLHWHVHEPMRHKHPHYPDIHHQHEH